MKTVPFDLDGTQGRARAGRLHLDRGVVETPVFMPVGTQGAIRAMAPSRLRETGSQIILANTYHLHQRPGERLVAKHGGLHRMMDVDLPMLTDSGGFQVFSLQKAETTEEGVTFAYELDGRQTFLSPEVSMEIQQALGADIAMVFDECLPFGVDERTTAKSIERTARWEARCKAVHTREDQSLFGIVQGGFWPALRKRSAEQITSIGFDGYAIGGLAVGEGHDIMNEVLEATLPHLPEDRPRYLMGVGRPIDLVEGVARGVDMFDCVIPTRHSRSGMFYTTQGRIRITDRRFRNDMYPVDTSCPCYACTSFTRAYLHHLFRVGEILGATLATVHNLTFWARFMGEVRQSILDGTFEELRVRTHETFPASKKPKPVAQGTKKQSGGGGRGGSGSSGGGGRRSGGGSRGRGKRRS